MQSTLAPDNLGIWIKRPATSMQRRGQKFSSSRGREKGQKVGMCRGRLLLVPIPGSGVEFWFGPVGQNVGDRTRSTAERRDIGSIKRKSKFGPFKGLPGSGKRANMCQSFGFLAVPRRFLHRLTSFTARKRPTFSAANAVEKVGHCLLGNIVRCSMCPPNRSVSRRAALGLHRIGSCGSQVCPRPCRLPFLGRQPPHRPMCEKGSRTGEHGRRRSLSD